MALKLSISTYVPYLAALACGWSMVHPSSDIRIARQLQSDFDAVKADNAALRQEVVGIVQFIRDGGLSGPAPVPPGTAVPDGAAGAGEVVGGSYMVSRGVPGFRRGSDWWLVGDSSPWGRVESAFRGGFVADGRNYLFVHESANSKGYVIGNE